MEFEELPEFQRDLKQLLKKYRSLREDLEVLKKFLSIATRPQAPLTVRIPGFGFELPIIIKVKKFSCRMMKTKGSQTGFRIIYAYFEEKQLIQFVEIYFKADQPNEDKDRILSNYLVKK
jgi:mRNA-degrading endonuclease RelE of RelBE toxin-antitoxin system